MARADASSNVKTNQQGQTLGRKGTQTRLKLLAATRKLLDS
jgi:hypothetical protein